MHIGIDLMGSDCSPAELFKAVQQIVVDFPKIHFKLFATQTALQSIKLQAGSHIDFCISQDSIEMQDDPLFAFRKKKQSSLILGFKHLKKKLIDAFVTAGNTGAIITASTLTLPLLPGIKRPALLAVLPTEKGRIVIIDVGGSVACKAFHLIQFAQLGVAFQRCQGIEFPKIGLLNIGTESKKGTRELREAYQILQQMDINKEMIFAGNIEGRDIFKGNVDVIVTDGFTGNILLKTTEGVSSFILNKLKGMIPDPSSSFFDIHHYEGAIVCGIERVVVKCHGQTSVEGFYNGIQSAVNLVNQEFIHKIKESL